VEEIKGVGLKIRTKDWLNRFGFRVQKIDGGRILDLGLEEILD
jgi:hypothetical protein